MSEKNKKNQQEALGYICNRKSGSIDTLINELGSDVVREFELVGFIKRGITADTQATWKAVPSANSFFKSIYGEPTLVQKIKGYFCHYVLRF
ncbi:hypothetical protein CLV62_1353 [Dysgonomonas alginatilytica]|uniref:Uncharacterized protein n=1 Tax=Dysgonomonas alginatilytica TaxID=1605892 RepID=A0A2V3PLD3_9BACT|nr:hypothetical protein [Dysgonomonas alginatilytica]PXV59431.1 hypothetical protein CLV62_1353 [Dysgonomonas alginatilytica]